MRNALSTPAAEVLLSNTNKRRTPKNSLWQSHPEHTRPISSDLEGKVRSGLVIPLGKAK